LRSIRVLRNVVTNYLRFFLGGVLGFVLTPLMVHLLGDGNYGLWVTVFSLTGYFGLFDQGIRPSLVRYVSRDHARADHEGLSRTVSSALALYSAVGVVTLIATAVVAFQFTHWFKVDASQVGIAREVVLLAGLSVALGFPFGVFGATLSGLQRYDIANAIGIVVSVVRAFAFYAVLKLGFGLVGLAWASLVMNLIGHGLSWIYARRVLPRLQFGWRFITRAQLKLIGSYSGFAFVGALATSIAFQTDALVITAFIGAAAVTPFALAAGLVDNARSLVHSATWVLSPTASELETRGESAKLHEMMIVGSKYAVLLSWPVLAALIIFGHNLIVTWVDTRHTDAVALLVILAVPTLISLPQSATSSVLYGISRHRGVVTLSLLNSLLNLGLSLWWVKSYGLAGVAMGTAVPLGLISGVATMVYGCRALELPIGRYLWEGMIYPGLTSLAFVVPAVIAQAVFRPVGWVPLGVTVGGCWLLFAACAWRFGLAAHERERWGRMVSGLLGSRNPDRTPEVAA
jgi:O-antigen/teichoic acid export membrane protein